MRLEGFQVKKFRSIEDSGWIDTEDITALIGTNESGKTNVLLPLWKLNPVEDGAINLIDDLPRGEYSTLRNSNPMPVFITAKYRLDENEQRDISDHCGQKFEPDEFQEIIVKKDYANKLYFEFPDENLPDRSTIFQTVRKLLEDADKNLQNLTSESNNEIERISEYSSTIKEAIDCTTGEDDASTEKITEILNRPDTSVKSSKAREIFFNAREKVICKLAELDQDKISDNREAIERIKACMPKYVYYSNYGNLDSQIYLSRVVPELKRTDLTPREAAKVRTLKTLFNFVGLDPEEIYKLGTESAGVVTDEEIISETAKKKEERDILLSSAASKFTKEFNEWWKQGNYNFEFKADGEYFQILVSDSARPERLPLEARSTGLQWFFSFYLVFLVESKQKHQNAILLLDEPGVTLHPLAQADLFKFFESLSNKNQLLYTTHSPFMVDSNHLERVRSVYIDENGKTVVSSDLRASEKKKGKNQIQSIYPVNAALGLSVSQTLLVNSLAVLVEGESDQMYLSAMKNLLIAKNKITPLKEIVFIPTGGTKGIKATAGILTGAKDNLPPIIIDGDKPGLKIKSELESDFYAADKNRIICLSEYSEIGHNEIEDMFPKEKMQKIASKFLKHDYPCDDDFEDEELNDAPMCNQIEEYAKKNEIQLQQGWKVKLAVKVKEEILKGRDKVITENDPEFNKFVAIFERIISFSAS